MRIPLDDPRGLVSADDAEAIQLHLTMGQAVERGANVVDLVIQDEFTHDVVVRGPTAWLVYDTT